MTEFEFQLIVIMMLGVIGSQVAKSYWISLLFLGCFSTAWWFLMGEIGIQ